MKKIRHFRESVNAVVIHNDIQSLNVGFSEENGTEAGLELAIAWLELYRDELMDTGNPIPLLDSLRAVTGESLLWLRGIQGTTQIVLADVEVPLVVESALCATAGPYHDLVRIRFTHQYGRASDMISRIVQAGHPKINRMLAVPIYKKKRVHSVLAILGANDVSYEKKDEMLLSFVAMLISMLRLTFSESV